MWERTAIRCVQKSLQGRAAFRTGAGDKYAGLDRFGRVAEQKWVTDNGTVKDAYTYAYDRDSNVTSKGNGRDASCSVASTKK